MCGRFALPYPSKTVAEHFSLPEEFSFAPRYNIAPSQKIAVIRCRKDGPGRQLALLRWGLIPSWAKDEKIGYKMINARAETAAEKPAFRSAYKQRRCLVAAGGYYEWKREGKHRQPYYLTRKDKAIFAFAGIWEQWRTPTGESVESCAILTTESNSLVRSIHDRMPVIVAPSAYDLWLGPIRDQSRLRQLLRACSPSALRIYAVSEKVNNPRNDSSDCLQEIRL